MIKTIRALLTIGLLVIPVLAQSSAEKPAKLQGLERSLSQLSAKVLKSTVGVRIGRTTGSGVIVSEDGYVITAAHLFTEPGQKARVTLQGGRVVIGETLGRMERDDYAMVKITTEGKWPHADMAGSQAPSSGLLCVGTGHPGGVQRGRSAPLRLGQVLKGRGRFIRTTCTIDLGDSGGPLFDLEGRVIGIHSRIGRSTRQNWHVPIKHYRNHWKRLVSKEVWGVADFPKGPIIGIHGEWAPGGALVVQTYHGLPARKAGIEKNDVIFKVAGQPIGGMIDLKAEVAKHKVGDEIVLRIKRKDQILEKKLVLVAAPSSSDPGKEATGMPTVETPADDAIAMLFGDETNLSAPFEDLASRSRASIVEIVGDSDRAVLGTVVGAEGWIITKSSEVSGKATCQLNDGRRLEARRVKELPAHDLLILKIEAKDLKPVTLVPENAFERGQFLVNVGADDDALHVGVVSVPSRRIRGSGGFLGVELEEKKGAGVRIATVQPGTAAERAELAADDIIVAIGGVEVENRADLIDRISGNSPKTKITLKLLRGEKEFESRIALGSRWPSRDPSRRSWRRRRNPYSQRKDGFEMAVQHDGVIKSSQCGGPIFDVNGHCVGINIARATRSSSYAIPSSVIVPLLRAHTTVSEEAERVR